MTRQTELGKEIEKLKEEHLIGTGFSIGDGGI